jgi:CRISPR-associated protein Cas5
MNISFLYNNQSFEIAILRIQPLAPLSMVSSMPGSHYKTLKEPSHIMLSGLFENILDLHLSINDRKAIREKIEQVFKKDKTKENLEFEATNSSYLPLLSHLFKVELVHLPPVSFFSDLWKRMYRRSDASVHPKGTPNLDHQLLAAKNQLPLDDQGKIINKEYETFFKDNIDRFPMYYTTLSQREYLCADGEYQIKLSITTELFELLSKALAENDLGYLGTNDGWVSIKIEKL